MDFYKQTLERMEQDGLLRHTQAWPGAGGRIALTDGQTLLNFSSNDYLGLASHSHVKQRAREALDVYGCSASASRLMCGTLDLHEQLEAALARLVGTETALLFGTGFSMNVGILASLAGPSDTIFSDRLIHASLIDGARLSRANISRFAHNGDTALARLLEKAPTTGRRIVISESVFSMDGDIAPVAALCTLAKAHGAVLLLDEAHAIGVFGQGAGVCAEVGGEPQPDFLVGTLGKALGSAGGFVACSRVCREYLINRTRSFIYSTAPPPPSVGAALGALECIEQDPEMGARLLGQARDFHARLAGEGLRVLPFHSQIVPIMVGENRAALELAACLRERGMLATAIRPPTVPEGSARIRLSVTLSHTPAELAWAADQIGQAARDMGLS